jgi:SpoIID/LytB domain protein
MRFAPFVASVLIVFEAFGQEVGEDFTRRDRTALLYSTKFLFTPEQIPIINVLVSEGQKEVRFRADQELRFEPEGEGGSVIEVLKTKGCVASIRESRPAKLLFYVSLARIPAKAMDAIRNERAKWEQKGVRTKVFERGSVFGFFGRLLDNRVVIIVEEKGFEDRKEAERRRDEVAKENADATIEIFEEVVERPFGVIDVRCDGVNAKMTFVGMVVVRAKGLLEVEGVEYGKGFAWHGKETRRYRGSLIFAPDRDGQLAVINAVDAEEFLKGLVPSEIYVDAPMEALKAQAVCARGELFAKLGQRHTADPYMVCADVHCQVYRGAGRENKRTSEAVDRTRGEMLFYKGQLVDSVYSANCGGHTEDGANVWQGQSHAYLKGMPDSPNRTEGSLELNDDAQIKTFLEKPPLDIYCNSEKWGKGSFRWEVRLSDEQIRKGVLEQTGDDPGKVKDIVVLKRGKSGRVLQIKVIGERGEVTVFGELVIRKALGKLKSSLFVVEKEGNSDFRFIGGGFGHGVGLCQVGAIGMAEKGKDYKEILKHYFGDVEIIRIY